MKKINLSIMILMFIFMMIKPISAASEINISYDMGFDNLCKKNNINPLKIEISYKEDFDGNLKICLQDKTYKQHIIIPKNSKKVFYFSIPINNDEEKINVCLENNNNIIESKLIKPKIEKSESIFIGVLGDEFKNYDYLKNIKGSLFENKNIHVIKLSKEFNYTLNEMESFNFIIMDNFKEKALSNENKDILKQYKDKGNLILNLKNGENEIQVQDSINKNITAYGISKILNSKDYENKNESLKNIALALKELQKPSSNILYFCIALLGLYIMIIFTLTVLNSYKNYIFSASIISFAILFYTISLFSGLDKDKINTGSIKIYDKKIHSYNITNINPYKKDNLSINLPNSKYITSLDNKNCNIDAMNNKINFEKFENHNIYDEKLENNNKANNSLNLSDKDILKGNIKNILDTQMKKVFLLIGDTVINVGDLEGMEEAIINYNLDHNLRNEGDYTYLEKIKNTSKLNDIESKLFEHYFYNIKDSEGAKLIGFTYDNEKLNINDKNIKTKNITMNIINVNLKSKEYITSGIIKPNVDYKENIIPKESREILLDNKEIEVYYDIPQSIKLNNMNFYTEDNNANIECFNYDTNSWETLNNNEINQNANSYISKGKLLLKINGYDRFIIPQISLNAASR